LVIDKDISKRAEVGYWLGRKKERQGIMSEALREVLKFGFDKLKLRKITARVFHFNIASQKLLEKYRFKKEGVLRKNLYKNRRYYDEVCYGLLKKEFES
jgi:RimJ/RimL family protein N-acetyltransferase